MGFISQDPGGRYRRRAAETRRRVLLSLIVIGSFSSVAYWRGVENTRSSEVAYKQQSIKLQSEKEELEKQVTSLRSDVQSTQVRYQQLEAKYKEEVPDGAFKPLADILKKQLNSGVKPERLMSVIQSVRPPKNCTEPSTKRFVMQTPVYKGPHGSVSFGNGAITITGTGEPAVSQSGSAEAWYDPGKPVTITFTLTGGKDVVKKGLLPIEYSTVIASKEYRFNVAAGERSFISVTSDSCDAQ